MNYYELLGITSGGGPFKGQMHPNPSQTCFLHIGVCKSWRDKASIKPDRYWKQRPKDKLPLDSHLWNRGSEWYTPSKCLVWVACLWNQMPMFHRPGMTSRGHNRWLLVDKRGDFSWTLLVTSRGHFCPREVLFLGEFSWTFFGWILVDTFWWW